MLGGVQSQQGGPVPARAGVDPVTLSLEGVRRQFDAVALKHGRPLHLRSVHVQLGQGGQRGPGFLPSRSQQRHEQLSVAVAAGGADELIGTHLQEPGRTGCPKGREGVVEPYGRAHLPGPVVVVHL